MAKKKTIEQFIQEAKKIHKDKYNYDYVEYKNDKTKIKIWCNSCKAFFMQTPHCHLKKQGCPFCEKNNRKMDINIFIERAKKIHNNKYEYNNIIYNGTKKKIKIFCNKCKNYFFQTPGSHLRGNGCPYCAGNFHHTKDDFIKKAQKIHGKVKYSYEQIKYINNRTKVLIYCNNCKKYFNQLPSSHTSGVGCPYCSMSKGEQTIQKILEQYNIKFEAQKKFKNCKNKRSLSFDFYLPDYNLCVEFQGEQHYSSKMMTELHKSKKIGIKKLILQRQNDKIKRNYCKQNNIKLLEIKYNDNIKNKLNETIGI